MLKTTIMEEIWKGHDVYENYEFSNYGRFRNKTTQQILKQTIASGKKGGYVRTFLMNVNTQQRQQVRIHRIIAELFVPNPDPINNVTVNHIDGVKNNNHYTNLEWLSVTDNNRHAHSAGLPNKWKKFTAQDIKNIRASFLINPNPPKVAKDYNVNVGTIRDILNYKTWWFVDEDKKDELINAYQIYVTGLKKFK